MKSKPIVRRKKVVKREWNYRVIKKRGGLAQSDYFAIYSVHYTNGKPHSWSTEPMHPIGETFNDFCIDFYHMSDALCKPILIIKNGKLVLLQAKKK